MKIDDSVVRHVAKLARIELTNEEVKKYQAQLGSIFDYIEQLKEVDVEGVTPLAHAGDFINRFRNDENRPCLPREAALQNAPEKTREFFVVPRVIEE